MYVQHRMAEQIDDLGPLLDLDETFLYICGIKGMEDGIMGVLGDRPGVDRLRSTGRLLIETY